ncbi:MAG: hypothetical protein OXF24_04330, partial [Hyphomicrobiales bacterium]|nr:hypothetical protein [Hyphomicrobiales bacterium]
TLTTDRNTGDSFELDSSSLTHVFTIAAEDNSVSFAPEHRSNSVIEDVAGGRATLTITLSNPAPVGGLPLKLTATGVTGVISFDETGSTDFLDFTIQPADGTTKEVPVFINDNSDDADPDAQIVTFTLTEQQGASPAFPSDWGSVITASGSNVHTLTVVDDENSAPGGTIGFKEEMTRVLEPGSGETTHPVTLTVDGGFTGDEFILNVAYGGTADRVQQAGVLALDYAASETVTVPARTAGDFTFDVTIRGDELIEIDETVNITIDETRLPGYLTAVQNGTTHVITIPANDNEVVFGNTTRVNEEDGKEERVTVSIAQAGPSGPNFVAPPGGVPLRISVLSSKVAPGGNFNIPPGADSGGEISFDKDDPAVYFADIEIEAGQKEVVVPIYIVGDQDEDSEVIRLQIEPQPGAAFPDEWGRVVRQRPPNTARFDRHTIHLTDTGILNPTGTLDFAIASSMADEGDTHIIEIDTTANIPPQGVAMMLAAAGTDITEDAEVTDTSTDPDTVSRITDGATVTATLMPADASATPSRPKPYISVRIINDSTSEPEETLRLTMLQTGLPDTLTVGTNITHDITISTSNNTVRFLAGADSSTTDEDTDMVTFTVDVPDEHQPAPVGGIPMKITATGEDKGVVSFDENDDTVDSKDISIGEGERSAEVTVYILPDDDIENETVRFVLTPRDGFPEAWGSILASANTYTLEITDTGPLEPFVGFLEDETFGFEGSPARIEFETNTLLPLDVTLNLRAPNDWIGRSQTLTDAKYNGNPITFLYAGRIRPGVLDVSIRPPSTPGGNPFIIIDIAEDTFPENREWLELTLDTSNSSDPDLVVKGKSVHTIRVDSNDQHAALESSEGTVREDQEVAHIGISFSGELPRNGLNMGMRVISGNENNVVSLSPDGAQNEIRFTVPYSGARRWDVPVYLKFDEDREDNRVEFRLFAQNSVGGFKLVPWGDISFGRTRYTLDITDVGIPPIGNVGFAGERTTALEPDASASPLNHTVPLVVKGEVRTAFDLTVGVDSNSTSLTNGISPNDFTAPSVVTIPVKAAGSRDHRINVTVPIAADTAPEPDETIILTIGREDLPVADGIISGQNTSHIVTIPVNDQQLALSANPAGSTSFDETAGQAGVRVQLTSSSAASGGALPQGGLPLRVEITEGNEDSVASFEETYLIEYHDFTVTSLPFDFPLYFRPDADNQPETIKLSLSTRSGFPSGWGGVDASLNTVTFTLTDSVSGGGAGVGPFPPSAMIGFVGSSIAVSEPPDGSGETQHEVQINVSGTVLESFNPDITLSQGGSSGLADSSDYRIGTSLPLNVARGFEGMKSVLVFISDDDVPEAAETLTLTIDESTLPNTVGLLDGAATFDVEIGPNDNTIEIVPPSPAPADYDNPAEGDTRQITIRANNPSVLPDGGIAVNFAIDPAESASVSPASHTFQETDGSGSPAHTVELTLTVTEDMIAEQEESFTFGMTAADTSQLVGWEIGEGSMFTVQPSSGPARHSIGFASPQSSSVHEGDSKELTVQLSEAHEQPILIAVDVEPADYADEIELSAGGSSFSAGDMLTVDANSSTVTLDVMIKDDQDFERAEDFTFTLSSATTSEISFPSNYFFEDHVYTLTVPDNDIGFDFVTDAIELEEDTTSASLVLNVTDTVDFEFVREVSFVNQHGEESNGDVTLQVTNPAGSTGNVWDAVNRTLTIPANTQNLSFTVTAVDDGVGEGREIVSVNVLEGESIVDTLAVTIPANDNTIGLAVQHPASPATTLNEGVPYELAIDIAAPLDAPAKLRIAALERDTFSTDPTHRNYPADLGFSVKGGIGSFEADASSAPEVVSQQQGGVNCRPLSSECRRTARGTLTIPAGVPQVVLLVTAVDDEVGERNETVSVEITPLAGGDALPEAWELAIPRQTRFSIPDNDNEMNFVDTDETVLEGQTTRKINIVQEESFPFGFTTKANVVITGTNGGAAEDIEIRRSDDGDVTYDAASGVMTVMDHQASFVIHAVADEDREGPETVTITLVEPGGADAYPEGYDIGDNDSFTVTIPANGNLLSFAKPADVPRNPNIIGCRGFHEDNDARLCALEQPGENIRPFDFNYIRSVVIDSPFTATQTVKITHNDTDAGSDDGQYTIRLADGNPGGTGWRRIDGQSGILTIPAGAAEIRLDMWF